MTSTQGSTETAIDGAADTSAGNGAIRPFRIDVPEELTDLRRRINATRWPDRETDASQGVRLEAIQALAAEKAYPNRIHYNNELDQGGHFAWEQPQILAEEIRATFRSLR